MTAGIMATFTAPPRASPQAVAKCPGAGYARGGGQPPGGFGDGAQADAQAQQLVAWLRTHQPGSTYLLAVQGSSQAGQYILAGASVLPMGGFSGQVPFPTNDQLATLVADGQLRYVLLGGRGGPGGEKNSNFTAWVRTPARSSATPRRASPICTTAHRSAAGF